ncbi:MAG: SMI1/KNR4 family protein [Trichocoleus desertorum ATA4-8-CV12]|jgi:hypothetical protein|nr:SMI1/KNR4 family protein [Trichocoleus desertorum ATA4-8-CV12]
MNNLITRFQTLIDFRRKIGQPVEQYFLPGLSRQYLQEKISQYPFYFPEEFMELYTWRNGTKDEDFLMFRDMAWLSLENSIAQYELMMEVFWSEGDNEEIGLEPEKMFPFAAFTGFNLYLSYPGQRMCPNIELPIICTGKGALDPYYDSFTSMLDTVEEWFKVGKHNEHSCDVEESLEREIWRKHNPEVFRIIGF